MRAITSRSIAAAPHASSTTSGVLLRTCWRTIASGARAEIAQQLRDFADEPHRGRAKTYTPFEVTGIPGAHGFTLTNTDTSGHNIIFADGPFTYHIGIGWGAQLKDPPTRAQLIAATRTLYKRVHGRPAPS